MIYDLIEEINAQVTEYIGNNMKMCSAEDLGLDIRCGSRFYVNEDGIAVSNGNRRALEYYGGFEYIQSDCVESAGNYTFYLVEDERVRDHVETYFESQGLCTSE